MASKRVTFNLTEEAIQAIDEMAVADSRSRSGEVDWLIKRARLNRLRDASSTEGDNRPVSVEEVDATAGTFPEAGERTDNPPARSGPKFKAMRDGDWGA